MRRGSSLRRFALPALLFAGSLARAQGAAPAAGAMRAFRTDAEFTRVFRELTASDDRVHCTGMVSVRGAIDTAPAAEATAGAPRPAVIRGRVTGPGGEPPFYASLFIEGTKIGSGTDSTGHYQISVPPDLLQPGRVFTVVQRAMGYRTGKREITGLVPGASVELDVSICAVPLRSWDVVRLGADDAALSRTPGPGARYGAPAARIGDDLVMVREGRLIAIHLGARHLVITSNVAAFGPRVDAQNAGSLYTDEVFVAGRRIAVVGDGGHGARTIAIFDLDHHGIPHHRRTYELLPGGAAGADFVTTALIGSKLLVHAEVALQWNIDDPSAAFPLLRPWPTRADSAPFAQLGGSARIFRPARSWRAPDGAALHSNIVCDLAAPEFRCALTAVLAPPAKEVFITAHAVYVWACNDGNAGRPALGQVCDPASTMLLRIPLGGAAPGALTVAGRPFGERSWSESADGALNVLVRDEPAIDTTRWPPLYWRKAALLRIPVASFGDGSGSARPSSYRALPAPEGLGWVSGFAGDYLLYSTAFAQPAEGEYRSELFTVPLSGGEIERSDLRYPAWRIERDGPASALILGAYDFTRIAPGDTSGATQTIPLSAPPRLVTELENAGDNPLVPLGRSLLAIRVQVRPPRDTTRPQENWIGLLFLRREGRRLTIAGRLPEDPGPERCPEMGVACVVEPRVGTAFIVDHRIFALLYNELIEARLIDGKLVTRRRLDLKQASVESPAPSH